MQFNIDMMIKDLVDAKIREEKDLRRKRRKGKKKRGGTSGQNTSALNSEVEQTGDSPAMTEREEAKGEDKEMEKDEEKQGLTENVIAMQRVSQQQLRAIQSVSNS